ncbi:MAG: hypothetical protein J2P16_00290 [Mycobacterium sp.]|nr:hypothetical protein [Mycobacterium sp.]
MVWQQIVAAVVAAAIPLAVKIVSDWHGVLIGRAGGKPAEHDIPTVEVQTVDEHQHEQEPNDLEPPTPEGESEAERLADEIRDATLHQQHDDDEETQS